MDLLTRSLVVAFACGAGACGAGTAAIASGGSGGGGGGDVDDPAALTALEVRSAKSSPATIAFTLTDPDGGAAPEVELYFAPQGQAARPITDGTGAPVVLSAGLVATPQGTENVFAWSFDADLGPGISADVAVLAQVRGGPNLIAPGAVIAAGPNAQIGLVLGNAPPVVQLDAPSAEVVGTATFNFRVSDPSPAGDLVDVRVEFNRAPGFPGNAWEVALPAGFLGNPQTPPAFAFANTPVSAAAAGSTELVFSWDVVRQLGSADQEVRVRFTAFDKEQISPALPSNHFAQAAATSGTFRVDNNREPLAFLGADALFANPDARRGIPVPVRATDAEGDAVGVLVQWRASGQAFPALPTTAAELAALAADPAAHPELQVATELPRSARGTVRRVLAGGTVAELPELAAEHSFLVSEGMDGRELEVLRPPAPASVDATSGGALSVTGPVGVLPARGGLAGLVLDRSGAASWRLRELDLTTGAVLRTVVGSVSGEPRALCPERGRAGAVLVASEVSGAWRVTRVELATGAQTLLATAPGGLPQTPLRGLASRDAASCVVTVGDALLVVRYGSAPAAVTRFRGSFQTPAGVAVDPFDPDRVFLAERDFVAFLGAFGRVLSIDLGTGEREALLNGGATFRRPEALAFDPEGRRLWFVSSFAGSAAATRELSFVSLAGGADVRRYEVTSSLPNPVSAISVGPDAFVCAAAEGANDLLVGGGVEQRRAIASYDPATRRVTLAAAPGPPVQAGDAWRIVDRFRPLLGSGGRQEDVFVWDSGDLPGGGDALLRAIPFDADLGFEGEVTVPKRILTPAHAHSVSTTPDGSTRANLCTASGDLDGDGDIDLVTGDFGAPAVRVATVFSRRFHLFSSHALAASVAFTSGYSPSFFDRALELADLNGDGLSDLLVATSTADVSLYTRSPASFAAVPATVGAGVLGEVGPVLAADLDGNGRLDVVCADRGASRLVLFPQGATGAFANGDRIVFGSNTLTPLVAGLDVADVNLDGFLDVVAASNSQNTFTVFRQTGASPVSFTSGAGAIATGTEDKVTSVAAGDLDDDGRPDVACAGFGLSVFRQSSSGAFASTPDLLLGGSLTLESYAAVRMADADGNGRLDLVAADHPRIEINGSKGELDVWLRSGPASFPPQPIAVGRGSGDFEVLDLDGDGALDFVGDDTFTGFGVLVRSFGAGRGVLGGQPSSFVEPGIAGQELELAAADFDGDGALDLAVGDRGSSRLSVFVQSAPGLYPDSPQARPAPAAPARDLAAADVDGDGDADLVLGTTAGVELFRQGSPLVFGVGPAGTASQKVSTPSVGHLRLGDVNGDGLLDLAVQSVPQDGRVRIFPGAGGGAFQTSPAFTLGGGALTVVALGDLDGDGDLDVASGAQDSVQLFLQGASGFGATPSQTLTGSGNVISILRPVDMLVDDIDEDGRTDIAMGNGGAGGGFAIWLRGPTGFANAETFGSSSLSPVESVAVADVDGDGRKDLVASNEGGLAFFLQRTAGEVGVLESFGNQPDFQISSLLGPTGNFGFADLIAGDFDGDGDLDLAARRVDGGVDDFDPIIQVYFGGH